MSQSDVNFIKKRINQICVLIVIAVIAIVFFETAGFTSKASKKDMNDNYTHLWLLINEQTVNFGNYMKDEKSSEDSIWSEMRRLQEEIREAIPYEPEAYRGPKPVKPKHRAGDLQSLNIIN